nr:methyltransferase domain-containing protein [Bacteroidota bacterium]
MKRRNFGIGFLVTADKYDLFIAKTQSKTYQSILKNIDSELNKNLDLLEIGTGTGIIPFSIFSKVSSITAIDISPEMIRVAKQKQKELNVEYRQDETQIKIEHCSILFVNFSKCINDCPTTNF